MKFPKYIRELARFESWLGRSLEEQGREAGPLTSVEAYSLLGSAKRFRPVLTLLVGECLQVEPEKLRSFCLAVEFLHAASLVHDDLPIMDNDDVRRGRPACHIEFGSADALLIGDKLPALAALSLAQDNALTPSQRCELVHLLFSSYAALCDGQALDMRPLENASRSHDEIVEELFIRHGKKTAALIIACCRAPVVVSAQSENVELWEALSAYGSQLGLLFQLTDDVLDADGLGAADASDSSNIVAYVGLRQTHKLIKKIFLDAMQALEKVPGDTAALAEICEQIMLRGDLKGVAAEQS